MRKTSHDGGDSTSITSGVENEFKKSAMKPKKSSLKRKPPNFSQESDDTAIEPLLQREKEKSEPLSAKYFGKGKTDSVQTKESNNKTNTTTTTGFCGTTESLLSFKDSESTKTTAGVTAPLHNYMNTNVFNTHDNAKANVTTKSQILVEIGSSKQNSYTPSPFIFTTAKIHTDSKIKQMEPVHVTPVPILSTIEVNVSKEGNIVSNERKISNGSSVINPVYSPMPLSKGNEEKVTLSSFSTIISPTMNKDAFGKTITDKSAPKLANITTAQVSSMKITKLPSTTSNSTLMKDNAKDKPGDFKEVKKEQTFPQNVQLPSKPFNLDSTKNNVTVKTIMPSSEKAISTTSAQSSQGDNSQIHKVTVTHASDNVNVSSYDSQHCTSNNKTQVSQSLVATNPAKTTSSSVGNKQLQRQKTTTEETTDMKLKVEPNIEHAENSSAKKLSSSQPKIIDSIYTKDGKVPNVSCNNTQSIQSKSSLNDTVNLISKTTSISTTTKPTSTSAASSNTVILSTHVLSKPMTTNTIFKAEKKVSPTTTAASNVNETNIASAVSSIGLIKSSLKDVAKTTSIVTTASPKVNSIQTQSQTSTSKALADKAPVVASTAKTTVSASSDKNKTSSVTTVKPPTEVAKTTATTLTQPIKTTSKTTATKTPSVTTSVNATLASATTSTGTKPSSSTPQVSRITSPLTSGSIATETAPAITTSISKTLSGTVSPKATTSQNITASQESGNKKAITAVGINVTSKLPPAISSEKSSAVNSSAPVSAGIIKSPNNNSSQVFGASKPSTTLIPKTESVTTLSKTPSSSASVTAATLKSPKDPSAATTNRKDSEASAKKPAATKTSVATKSPLVSSANKPIVGTTTKISSSETSSVPTSAIKKTGTAVTAKTGLATTSTKIPSTPTLKKVPDVTSSSSTTTAAATIKPTTTSATQVSANKSVGSAGSSVPSSTPALRTSELDKKSGSKSGENNKDGKVSKA